MSAATERYERHLDILGDINGRLIRACFSEPLDGPGVTAGFKELLAWRKTAFEMVERDKPEETAMLPAPGTLEKVNAHNPRAVCDALKFNSGQ